MPGLNRLRRKTPVNGRPFVYGLASFTVSPPFYTCTLGEFRLWSVEIALGKKAALDNG
jgi:hypothetical protein